MLAGASNRADVKTHNKPMTSSRSPKLIHRTPVELAHRNTDGCAQDGGPEGHLARGHGAYPPQLIYCVPRSELKDTNRADPDRDRSLSMVHVKRLTFALTGRGERTRAGGPVQRVVRRFAWPHACLQHSGFQ